MDQLLIIVPVQIQGCDSYFLNQIILFLWLTGFHN